MPTVTIPGKHPVVKSQDVTVNRLDGLLHSNHQVKVNKTMGKGIEVDSLEIPAGQIRIGDVFYNKGQAHTVKRIEPLTQYLIRIHCNVMSFEAALVVDSRLIFPAVLRTVVKD